MHHLTRAILFLTPVLVLGPITVLAQAPRAKPAAPPTPACALLTVADIRTATGRADYPNDVEGDPEVEGAAGGSSCQYGGATTTTPGNHAPLVSLVLIKGKNWTAQTRGMALPAGCTREPVTGVGDEAFLQSCPTSKSMRSSPLYVKVGANDLIVQMDIEPPATQATVGPIVMAVARAAVKKLR